MISTLFLKIQTIGNFSFRTQQFSSQFSLSHIKKSNKKRNQLGFYARGTLQENPRLYYPERGPLPAPPAHLCADRGWAPISPGYVFSLQYRQAVEPRRLDSSPVFATPDVTNVQGLAVASVYCPPDLLLQATCRLTGTSNYWLTD